MTLSEQSNLESWYQQQPFILRINDRLKSVNGGKVFQDDGGYIFQEIFLPHLYPTFEAQESPELTAEQRLLQQVAFQILINNILEKRVPEDAKLSIVQNHRPLNRRSHLVETAIGELENIPELSNKKFKKWWHSEAKPVLLRVLHLWQLRAEWLDDIKPSYWELDEVVENDLDFTSRLYSLPLVHRQRYIERIRPKINQTRDRELNELLASGNAERKNYEEKRKRKKKPRQSVTMKEAKRDCWRSYISKDTRTLIAVCRDYLGTHKIERKPRYPPGKLAGLLYSENSQGRTERYLPEKGKLG